MSAITTVSCGIIIERLFRHKTHRTSWGGRFFEPLERRAYLTAPVWSNFNFNHNPPFGQPQTHSATIDFNIDVRPGQITNPLEYTDLIVQKVGPDDTFIAPSSIILNNPAGTHGSFTFTV